MIYFDLPELTIDKLTPDVQKTLHDLCLNIDSDMSICYHLIESQDYNMIEPLLKLLPKAPEYTALIYVPEDTRCRTHVDDIGGRKSAINVLFDPDHPSIFQYMEHVDAENDEEVVLELTSNPTKCWDVSLPHRINNIEATVPRCVISFSYYDTVDELYQLHLSNSE